MDECCLFLRGELFVANATEECTSNVTGLDGCGEVPKSYLKIGNTSLLETSIASSIIGRENIYNKALERSRVNIEAVGLDLTIECVHRMNLIQAFYGDEVKYMVGSKSDRFCFNKHDRTLLLSRVPFNMTVSLLDSFGNVLMFLTEGYDYRVEDNKLTLIDAEFMPVNATTLVAEYQFENVNSYELNALDLEPKYKEIVFIGKNASGSDEELIEAKYFRVLLKPIETFDLISKGMFLNLPLIGVVEESNNGWFKIKRQYGAKNESGSVIY